MKTINEQEKISNEKYAKDDLVAVREGLPFVFSLNEGGLKDTKICFQLN